MFTEAFPILSTRDLPRLLGFYQGLLGFTETYRFPAEGTPAYVGLELGSPACQVELLRGHGVTIIEEPADMPWGERAARVADPDGNRLLILSRLG